MLFRTPLFRNSNLSLGSGSWYSKGQRQSNGIPSDAWRQMSQGDSQQHHVLCGSLTSSMCEHVRVRCECVCACVNSFVPGMKLHLINTPPVRSGIKLLLH